MSTPLALYHYPSCFFCGMVRRTIEELGIDVELRDIRQNSEWRSELISARGRQTVPVLRIENQDGTVQWLPESRDIMEYLRARAS